MSDKMMTSIKRAVLPLPILDGTDKVTREGQRKAAVLFPLVMRDDWHVILTQRPETMPSHPGQIAFPGGKAEAGETIAQTALRETEEEIGVGAKDIQLIGRLPSFDAVSKFRVTPYVGVVSSHATITPDPREVESVFEVPMSFLMNPDNHIRREVFFDEKTHVLFDMPYDEPDGTHRNIWGMTAMTIYRMWQRGFEAKAA
ncbi:NUDIX hydrolase [Litorimonas sp. WD9-15]|uniref:NUDIX hydrolase n=1 Tax=Litorimonas sp. WD9-15 TaxID=3418716 RepID=UPI003D094A0A